MMESICEENSVQRASCAQMRVCVRVCCMLDNSHSNARIEKLGNRDRESKIKKEAETKEGGTRSDLKMEIVTHVER